MRIRLAILALVLFAQSACRLPDLERDPDEVPMSEILTLTRAGTGALRMNPPEAETFLAMIPLNASTRVVTFRTTAGVFPMSGTKEIKVRAERDSLITQRLVARTVLRADTIPGTAYVSATIGDFTAYDSIRFEP